MQESFNKITRFLLPVSTQIFVLNIHNNKDISMYWCLHWIIFSNAKTKFISNIRGGLPVDVCYSTFGLFYLYYLLNYHLKSFTFVNLGKRVIKFLHNIKTLIEFVLKLLFFYFMKIILYTG